MLQAVMEPTPPDLHRLIRDATHGLRNHLGIIIAYSELLETTIGGAAAAPHASKQLETIRRAAWRIEEQIETLAQAARAPCPNVERPAEKAEKITLPPPQSTP